MAQLQIAFTKTIEKKNRKKVLEVELKHILEDHPEYAKNIEIRNEATKKINAILDSIGEAYPKIANELASIRADLKSDKELLADLAMKEYLEGKPVEVVDVAGEKFAPEFSVKFVKIESNEKEKEKKQK